MSLHWQASWDLLPCVWWNFFHHSLFCYSFCNVLDILHVWCFPSRFPYCPHILSWCSSSFFYCQGTTSFLLQSCLGVLLTPTSDTFSILWTLTTSQFQRHFGVLPIPNPFQQSPTLLHTPSTLTPRLTPPPKATPRPPPPPKVTQRPLQTPHPPIPIPLQHSSETLWVIAEVGRPLQHPILRVTSLK